MSMFAGRISILLVAAALGLGGRAAQAQTAPVSYWIPGWPLGFGGQMTGQAIASYGNFPGFDGGGARDVASARYDFSNGWFVGSEGGGMGLSGLSQAGAFGTMGSLRYEGTQFGYHFQHGGGLPVTIYAGFDTLKYDAGSAGPFAAFDSNSGPCPAIARMPASKSSRRRMSACRSGLATPNSPRAPWAMPICWHCPALPRSRSAAAADLSRPHRSTSSPAAGELVAFLTGKQEKRRCER